MEGKRRSGLRLALAARPMPPETAQLAQERGEVRSDVDAADLARSYKESYLGSLLAWSLTPSTRLAPSFQRAFEHFWSAAAAKHSRIEKKGSER